ncbi:hypothetical protein ELI_0725 [Eubacterium callanderi]|uniref:Uncharacterized protein n=1 Tax=Eubacterium callanderi TaxID=53442 RepID=E3GJA4_9FIRM|nr:hypothetical protein ELI_0725 [Eubacterium callanderi]
MWLLILLFDVCYNAVETLKVIFFVIDYDIIIPPFLDL